MTEERLRIARELHDVIAHSMSVIAVQSAVGNHVIDTQPAEARQALAAIEATSRSALTEMRRLLGVLRQEGEPRGSLAPAPGLADLASLVGQVQDAGLQVWINVDGQRGPGPAGHRPIGVPDHPGGAHERDQARRRLLRQRDDQLSPGLGDRGDHRPGSWARRRVPPARTGSGHGIIGMRERVAVFGGEFAAGPGPDGGFRVRACFPIAEVTR